MVGGLIPTTSILGHPLGSNIQHILKNINFESEDSVKMKGNNLGHLTTDREVTKASTKTMSHILDVETASRAVTHKRPQSSTPA